MCIQNQITFNSLSIATVATFNLNKVMVAS